MITLLTHIAPIILGFLGKFMTLKAQDSADQQKLMLTAMGAKTTAIESARKYETPAAATNRRAILWFLMAMIGTSVLGFALFNVPVYVEHIQPSMSFLLGLITLPQQTEWIKIEGIPAFRDFFTWMAVIIEMYFGAQLAKRV